MSFQPIHIHRSNIDSGSNVFLLLIPTLIFGLIIAAFIFSMNRKADSQIATTSENNVLGEEKDTEQP